MSGPMFLGCGLGDLLMGRTTLLVGLDDAKDGTYVVDNRWQPGRGLAAALAVSSGFSTLLWWGVFG
jgi:hypothetical protein